jgi:hypothetical protein
MSTLFSKYNSMSKEEQEKIGKVSSKISTSGAHLVQIKQMFSVDDRYIRIIFESKSGQTADMFIHTTHKSGEADKVEKAQIRALNKLKAICEVLGITLEQLQSKVQPAVVKVKGEDKTVDEFKAPLGKDMYILTSRVIEPGFKDPKVAYVNQVIDEFNFFDANGRSSIEIFNGEEVGTMLDSKAEEAKNKIEIAYGKENNPVCKAKLRELQGGTTQPADSPISDDDI